MDNQKDKNNNGDLSEVKGQQNESLYLFSKSEKIASALYMITNFFSNQEPLKWKIRESAICLLESATSLGESSLSNRDLNLRRVRSEIGQVRSYFQIAFRSGFVSLMNYSILDQELNNLADFVEGIDRSGISSKDSLFNESFFMTGLDRGIEDNQESKQERSHPIKDIIKDKIKSPLKTEKSLIKSYRKPYNNNKTNRQDEIMKIIKDKGEVTVKDVALEMKEYSEKTIQRELIKMAEKNILDKEGERRWTKYRLSID